MTKRHLLAVAASGLWVATSEFLRNEILFKSLWTIHYTSLGLTFPSSPINGCVWVMWSFLLAAFITLLIESWSMKKTVAVTWVVGFVLMWLVVGNLGVLPFGILWYAIPLSVLEVVVATLIAKKVMQK